MSEKLCLQWNEFRDSAVKTIGNLREDKDFTDVTLVAADGTPFEAHKVILANSSPFFQKILKKNQHPQQLIYMRGVESDDLLAVVNFLYCGEANVYQENLDSFLAIAEELQLKGLMGKINIEEEISTKAELPSQENKVRNYKQSISKSSAVLQYGINQEISTIGQEERAVALKSHFLGNLHELDEKCNSMMDKTLKKHSNGLPLYRCKSCGKEATNSDLKKHIEANHLEGISIPCNICEKTFRSRNSMRQHNTTYHKGN